MNMKTFFQARLEALEKRLLDLKVHSSYLNYALAEYEPNELSPFLIFSNAADVHHSENEWEKYSKVFFRNKSRTTLLDVLPFAALAAARLCNHFSHSEDTEELAMDWLIKAHESFAIIDYVFRRIEAERYYAKYPTDNVPHRFSDGRRLFLDILSTHTPKSPQESTRHIIDKIAESYFTKSRLYKIKHKFQEENLYKTINSWRIRHPEFKHEMDTILNTMVANLLSENDK